VQRRTWAFASERAVRAGSVAVSQVLPWEGFPQASLIHVVIRGPYTPFQRPAKHAVSPQAEPLPDARYARSGLADGVVMH